MFVLSNTSGHGYLYICQPVNHDADNMRWHDNVNLYIMFMTRQNTTIYTSLPQIMVLASLTLGMSYLLKGSVRGTRYVCFLLGIVVYDNADLLIRCGYPSSLMNIIQPGYTIHYTLTVEPPIKDTLKEDKPPNKGQAVVYSTHSIENHL